MEQKKILTDALKTYQQIQKNIYQVQTNKYRWVELRACSQQAICKRFKISASVLSKALKTGIASERITTILDDLANRVRLARLYMSKKTDIDQLLEVANG